MTIFEEYIDEFGLTKEVDVKAGSTDLDKFEVSVSKGILSINKAVVNKLGLDKKPYVEVYTGKQQSTVIIGIKCADKGKDAMKVKVLKTKPTKINLARYLLKYGMGTSAECRVDLVDCDTGYLVFGLTAVKREERKPAGRAAPFGEVKEVMIPGTPGIQSIIDGSDF